MDLDSQHFFSLHCDETTQAQVKKQMDLRLRYWSSLHNEVWCRYYKSLFFGHAEAEKFQNVVHYAVRFTQHFRHYLLGREFVVRTDHSSLQWLVNFKEPQGQLARWLEVLNQYNMTIQHRGGKQHTNADALSRLETDKPCKEMSIFVKPENLPCAGCKHCSRVHEKWQDFTKINDVIPLAAVRVAKIDKIFQFLISDQVNGCMAKT